MKFGKIARILLINENEVTIKENKEGAKTPTKIDAKNDAKSIIVLNLAINSIHF